MKNLTQAIALWRKLFAEVWVVKHHSNKYKSAHKVSLALKYPEKWKKKLILKNNFWSQTILTNLDLTQNFVFILSYKIYLNWIQKTWS